MGFLSSLTAQEVEAIAAALAQVTPPPTPTDGPTLYAQNCAGCHGNLASSTKACASAASTQAAINGNVGGMGSLSSLTAQEVEAIAAALAQVTPPPTPTDGPGLYAQKCASCHGNLANSSKRGATVARTQAAIAGNVGGMGYLGSLTQSQLEAIIDALSPSAPTVPTVSAFSLFPACGEVNIPVTISVSPAMGEAFYKYWVNSTSYCETESPNWEVIEDWTTEPTTMWTPLEPGRYAIIVWVTDDISSECTEIMGASYGVGEGNCIDPIGMQLISGGGLVNEPVTITAIGGERNLQYKFWVNDSPYCDPSQPANWVLLQDWNLANTATFTPPAEGVYTLVVWSALDTSSPCTGVGEMSYVVGESLTPVRPPATTEGATLYAEHCASCHGNLANSTKAGASAARTEAAINGNVGGMGYLDSLTSSEVEAIAAALAPSPPPAAPAVVAFSLDPACGAVDVPVTISVDPAAGGPFYKYWVNNTSYCETESRNWEVIEDWTTETTAIWTPLEPGRYTIIVWVTDDISSECTEIMGASYGVGEANCIDPVELQLTSGDGLVNEPVTITAIGGESNLEYKFWVNDSSYCDSGQSPNWVLLQDWSLSNTATFTPPAEGVYTLVVWSALDTTSPCTGIGGMSYVVGESLTPVLPPSTTDGVTLYAQHCASCHGSLSNSTKAGTTAARTEAAIDGNVGGMGYLSFLTAQEIEAIAAVLAPSTVNTSPPLGALDGPTLYAQYCASCHGNLANSTKRGTTAEKIKSAISWWWTDMRLLVFLTDEEIQLIADALAQ